MANYVLWDVDGTLLKNGARASRLYDEAIEAVAEFVPDTPGQGEHGKTDGQIIAERLAQYGLDADLHDAVTAKLADLSEVAYSGPNRREVAPGVREALVAVREAGWVNALLTGNSPARARVKIAGAGLDADDFDWAHSYFGDRARERSEITVAANAALTGHAQVIVGDTPSDDAAAQAAGIPFIAVATGVFSADELRSTGALVVLDDLVSGLDELIAQLDGLAREAAAS
ncbi:HAD family hydrolase [Herbiconiux sp. L3-i23]|uniref:HAD family hydrolase n=1 Tax=Herbiconiux sp. L3-i23 TaxID=2905871 RepID=UPI002047A322|nr:HAD family hydrolase [Herbiconiux sp. L3-i23]BDI23078.1 haloacid dehalogenase [Herbiconiux sp. L3-i23]